MSQPIGVFDSGIGGLSVLRALRATLPGEGFVYLADAGFAPYGERGDAYVAERSLAIARRLREQHRIKALVVACNTATAAAIHLLRETYPGLPVVGVEPALKPAVAASRTRRIGVLATRGTLASAKFRALHDALAPQAGFACQPCDGLAEAIEHWAQSGDASKVIALSARYAGAIGTFGTQPGQIDTLVLGCTHYPFASAFLRGAVGPQVQVIDTAEPVARQLQRLLQSAGQLSAGTPSLELLSTGDLALLQAAADRWLEAPPPSFA